MYARERPSVRFYLAFLWIFMLAFHTKSSVNFAITSWSLFFPLKPADSLPGGKNPLLYLCVFLIRFQIHKPRQSQIINVWRQGMHSRYFGFFSMYFGICAEIQAYNAGFLWTCPRPRVRRSIDDPCDWPPQARGAREEATAGGSEPQPGGVCWGKQTATGGGSVFIW